MPDRRLRELLDELHAEIESVEASAPEARERLMALVSDLERRIEEPADREHHDSVLRDVREAISYFEVDNPRATGLLNHIMVTLGNMGI